VLSALLHTLRHDPSVDVRLAALDALSRHSAQPQVRTSVVNALQDQQSPLVQVAFIDQLVEWHDREAAPHLEKLRQSPKLNPTVRQRADCAISNLHTGETMRMTRLMMVSTVGCLAPAPCTAQRVNGMLP